MSQDSRAPTTSVLVVGLKTHIVVSCMPRGSNQSGMSTEALGRRTCVVVSSGVVYEALS